MKIALKKLLLAQYRWPGPNFHIIPKTNTISSKILTQFLKPQTTSNITHLFHLNYLNNLSILLLSSYRYL